MRKIKITEEEKQENIEYNKKYIAEYLKYIDPNFFEYFKLLLDNILQDTYNDYDYQKLEEELKENKSVDLNIIINDCYELFNSINPMYKEMATNILNDPKKIKFSIAAPFHSNNQIINFQHNWTDFLMLVHEVTHDFIEKRNFNYEVGMITELFAEVPSIIMEYLATDYLKEKYNIEIDTVQRYRICDLEEERKNLFDEPHCEIIDFIKDIYPEQSINQLRKISDFDMSTYIWTFSHTFGMLIANYIYTKIKEDPQNISMLDDMLTVLAKSKEYPEECIALLEKMGLPIIKEGKICLDEESIKILYDSFFIRYDKYKKSKNEENQQEINHMLDEEVSKKL